MSDADFIENVLREENGLWSILQDTSLPNLLNDGAPEYNQRLLAFAPQWRSDGGSTADRQLVCASITSIVALCKYIGVLTTLDPLLPTTVIDSENGIIRSNVEGFATADFTVRHSDTSTAQKSSMATIKLTANQLSMFFIIGHAVNMKLRISSY